MRLRRAVLAVALSTAVLPGCSLLNAGDSTIAQEDDQNPLRGPTAAVVADVGLRPVPTSASPLTGTSERLCLDPAPGVRSILDCSVVTSGDERLAWTLVTMINGDRQLSIYRGGDDLVEFLRAIDSDRTWRQVQVVPSKLTTDWVDDLLVGIERWTDQGNVALELDIVSLATQQLTHRTLPAGRARVDPMTPDVIETWSAKSSDAGERCCTIYRYEQLGYDVATQSWSVIKEGDALAADVPVGQF